MEADLARERAEKERQAAARREAEEEERALAPSDPEPDHPKKDSSIEDDIDYAEKFANQQKSEDSYGDDFDREEPKPKAAPAAVSKSKDDYSDAFNESDIDDEYV